MNNDLKKIENLAKAAVICGAVSLLVGGVFLSAIGVVCALVSFSRLIKYKGGGKPEGDSSTQMVLARLDRTVKASLIVCALALILNAVTLWLMWPVVQEFMSSGSLDSLQNLYGLGGSSSTSGAGTSATWG